MRIRASLVGTMMDAWLSAERSTSTHACVNFADDAPFRLVPWEQTNFRRIHVRTCGECHNEQVCRDPATVKGFLWLDLKCKVCGSTNMDYGSARYSDGESMISVREDE